MFVSITCVVEHNVLVSIACVGEYNICICQCVICVIEHSIRVGQNGICIGEHNICVVAYILHRYLWSGPYVAPFFFKMLPTPPSFFF